MEFTTYHDNTNPQRRDRNDATTDGTEGTGSLTRSQYIAAPEALATSPVVRDGAVIKWTNGPRLGWLQLGFNQPFECNQFAIPIAHLPPILQGFRILHLTDLHAHTRWVKSYDILLDRLDQNPPDLILFTGDFVDNVFDHRPALPVLERFLTQLTSRLGVFGIIGNHDRDLLAPRLAGWGVHLIRAKHVRLEAEGASIELIGLPGVRRRDFDPDWVVRIPPPEQGVPRVVLAHYPDQINVIGALQAHLVLSGHTHGGQVCLPGPRPLLTHDSLPKKMSRGCHRFGETLLVVNRGFGTVRWPIRVNAPAEVIELTLTAAASS